jgi:hypothetical protein
MSGAERWSVFWNENAVPNPPRQTYETKSTGDLPIARRKRANSAAAIASASSGMATYSELARSFSARSDPVFRDAVPSVFLNEFLVRLGTARSNRSKP